MRILRFYLVFLSKSHSSRLDVGSRPAVGSSSTTKSHLPRRATAIASLRCCPPLKLHACLSINVCNRNSWVILSISELISSLSSPLKMLNSYMCSYTVKLGKMMLYCGHMPILFLFSSRKVSKVCPLLEMVPSEGAMLPIRMLIRVDLPAPLGPSNTNISSLMMSTLTFLRA